MDLTSARTVVGGRRLLVALACVPALLPTMLSDNAYGHRGAVNADVLGANTSPLDSASLVQCLTASEPAERAATFSGEMTAIAGAARMSMRVELLERMAGETGYRVVAAPGLGVWRSAVPGVGVYKYVKQVTNLTAPADYRGLFSFRWQGPHGRTLKRDERRTRRCSQPAPIASSSPAPLE